MLYPKHTHNPKQTLVRKPQYKSFGKELGYDITKTDTKRDPQKYQNSKCKSKYCVNFKKILYHVPYLSSKQTNKQTLCIHMLSKSW